jgi:hypothetical protein
MLPLITKILIIGWQAKEAHFLRMLLFRVPNLKHLMVVGADENDARNTFAYFCSQLEISPVEFVGRKGFTDFIVNQEGHIFFLKK